MTIAVNLETIATAIAGISVTGVNMRGIDKIPENALSILPVFYPSPTGFVTDMAFERVSFGADNSAKMNLTYTLNYTYLHAPVGSGGGLLAVYAGMITNIVLILEAIFANSTPNGAINMELAGISDIGVQTDPAGETNYHGVSIAFRVEEYVQ